MAHHVTVSVCDAGSDASLTYVQVDCACASRPMTRAAAAVGVRARALSSWGGGGGTRKHAGMFAGNRRRSTWTARSNHVWDRRDPHFRTSHHAHPHGHARTRCVPDMLQPDARSAHSVDAIRRDAWIHRAVCSMRSAVTARIARLFRRACAVAPARGAAHVGWCRVRMVHARRVWHIVVRGRALHNHSVGVGGGRWRLRETSRAMGARARPRTHIRSGGDGARADRVARECCLERPTRGCVQSSVWRARGRGTN